MHFATVRDNLARVREEIGQIQAIEGLTNDVRIVGVTKGHPVEAIRTAARAGLEDVGENRVQEALGKRQVVTELDVRWHLIGHLQTNKAKLVPGVFSVVHSVDSLRVGDALARAWERHEASGADGSPLSVLVQVNVAGEAQKAGCSFDEAPELVHRVAEMSALSLVGLMTMAPFTDDVRTQRKVFADLRALRDRLMGDGLDLPELSMGMSGDYRAAVMEGATMLRLGTVLFGERAP